MQKLMMLSENQFTLTILEYVLVNFKHGKIYTATYHCSDKISYRNSLFYYSSDNRPHQKYVRCLWTVINMEKAIALYKKGGVTLQEAAIRFNVPQSTLHTR